jgi:hypothetical protein
MKNRMAAIMSGVLLGIAVPAPAAPVPNSADWLPVDQDVWTLFTEEPQAHLSRAHEDLSKNDTKDAAAEIRRADTFLKIQEKRLAESSRQLTDLAKDIESGQIVSAKEVEVSFNSAVGVLDYHQPMIPVMTGTDGLFVDEADYHLAQAKSRLKKKDNKAAVGEIRRAAAYLKLKAVHAEGKMLSELLASAAELGELGQKVDEGESIVAKDLEKAFKRAHEAVGGVL